MVAYDPTINLARFSIEFLSLRNFQGTAQRSTEFLPDDELPASKQVTTRAYTRSGYDRGHLAPAADFKHDQEMMRETFELSNIAPQDPELNREAWSGLESATRACIKIHAQGVVVTGITPSKQRLASGLMIPSAFWKVIYLKEQGVRAFMMKNIPTPKTNRLAQYDVTLEEITRASGVQFPATWKDTEQRNPKPCHAAFGK